MSEQQDTEARGEGEAKQGEAKDDKAKDDKAKQDEPSEERLEEVEEHIEQARRDGDEAAHGLFYEGEHSYFDSGSTEEQDDQTITPPG